MILAEKPRICGSTWTQGYCCFLSSCSRDPMGDLGETNHGEKPVARSATAWTALQVLQSWCQRGVGPKIQQNTDPSWFQSSCLANSLIPWVSCQLPDSLGCQACMYCLSTSVWISVQRHVFCNYLRVIHLWVYLFGYSLLHIQMYIYIYICFQVNAYSCVCVIYIYL